MLTDSFFIPSNFQTYICDPVHRHTVQVEVVPQVGLSLVSLVKSLLDPVGKYLRVFALKHQLDPGNPILGGYKRDCWKIKNKMIPVLLSFILINLHEQSGLLDLCNVCIIHLIQFYWGYISLTVNWGFFLYNFGWFFFSEDFFPKLNFYMCKK